MEPWRRPETFRGTQELLRAVKWSRIGNLYGCGAARSFTPYLTQISRNDPESLGSDFRCRLHGSMWCYLALWWVNISRLLPARDARPHPPVREHPAQVPRAYTIGFLNGKSVVRIHRELLHERRMTGLHFWAAGYGPSGGLSHTTASGRGSLFGE